MRSCQWLHLVAAARRDRNVRPTIAIRESAAEGRVLRADTERDARPVGGKTTNRLAVAPPAPPAPHRPITIHTPLRNHPQHQIQAVVRSHTDSGCHTHRDLHNCIH